jgi:repressor of nif and glnA expression
MASNKPLRSGNALPLNRPLMPPLTEKMPIAPGGDADEADLVTRHPPLPAEELAEQLKQHGERWRPILVALRDQPWRELATTRDLLDALSAQGIDLAERTLRLYLSELAEAGLIERHGRRGYRLTEPGAEIARELTINRRLGAIIYSMEETTCQVTFDPLKGEGLVSINLYVIPRAHLPALCDDLEAVFRAKLAVGSRVLLAAPGDEILGRRVPAGCIGLGTMCSLTIAGLLLRHGVPTHPLFGGLLRVEGWRPQHVLEMIRYEGTSVSPNEVFIRGGFTSVGRAAALGSGLITASFREAPMGAAAALREVARTLEDTGFPGVMLVGRPGQPVLNVPVHEGRVGLVLATGLNPVAGLWERGLTARAEDGKPMVGPVPYAQLIPFATFRHQALLRAR